MGDAPRRVIHLHAESPAKPPAGQPCNGCGACCAWQPCPLGVVVSRQGHGRCRALQWHADAAHYRCGMVSDPQSVWPALPGWAAGALRRLARRWIAAGIGCDAEIETEAATAP